MKFRKKPIVVDAFQMTKERCLDDSDWPIWLCVARDTPAGERGSLRPKDPFTGGNRLEIVTLEGVHDVSWGDWIIRGVAGELYPCKPDIFAATYEETDDD